MLVKLTPTSDVIYGRFLGGHSFVYLFARTHNLLQVILFGETLDRGQGFSSVSLLDPNVD